MTLLERRLQAEWNLLHELATVNPGRLMDLRADDLMFSLVLHGPPVTLVQSTFVQDRHAIRVQYPVHFPAAPMELYLDKPVRHPNIHPETGFVCLWDRHRVSYTIEHALHRTVSMISGKLFNPDALHVMQNDALTSFFEERASSEYLLQGIDHSASELPIPNAPRRRRLQ